MVTGYAHLSDDYDSLNRSYTALREAVAWYLEVNDYYEHELTLINFNAFVELTATLYAAEQRLREMCSNGGENP